MALACRDFMCIAAISHPRTDRVLPRRADFETTSHFVIGDLLAQLIFILRKEDDTASDGPARRVPA